MIGHWMWSGSDTRWCRWTAALLVSGVGSAYVVKWTLNWRNRRCTARRCKEYRQQIDYDLENLKHKLENGKVSNERRREICSLSLDELISQLQKGQIVPTEALEAYQAKALDAHRKTNCLTGVVKDAEEIAKHLESSEERGPLFGVPISVKESIPLKDHPCTTGRGKRVDEPIAEDCMLVKTIKKQGGIPFIRTNLPTTAMSLESSNAIFGAVLNPYDPTRTAGGSTGGEGALIGCGGSPLGFGGDIGGSIRHPAAMCGICGLRPSEGRLSTKSRDVPINGQTAIRAVKGPMARDVDALVTAMRALCVSYMHRVDPNTPPIPFNNDEYESTKPLKIGYYTYDGYIRAVPACQRAVMVAKEGLERRGHELVPWQPRKQGDVLHMAFRAYNGAGKEIGVVQDMVDEPHDMAISWFTTYGSYSQLRRKIVTSVINLMNPRKARFISAFAETRSGADWWRLITDIEAYRDELMQDWDQNQLDAVICPAFAYPATKLGHAEEIFRSDTYLAHFNVANFPAGVVPVTKVTEADVQKLMQDVPKGDDLYNFGRKDAVGSEGLPVGVQCATRTFEEEKCLRVMKEIELGLKIIQQ